MPDSFSTCTRSCTEVWRKARELQHHPEDVDAWYELGVALSILGDRSGALLALRSALSRNAGHIPSHLALGRLLFDCGQVERALQCFERAVATPA